MWGGRRMDDGKLFNSKMRSRAVFLIRSHFCPCVKLGAKRSFNWWGLYYYLLGGFPIANNPAPNVPLSFNVGVSLNLSYIVDHFFSYQQ